MLRVKPEKEIKHEVTEEKAAKQEVKVRTTNIKREIKHESQEEAVFDEYEERNIRLLEIAAHMAHLEMEKSSLLREQGEVDTQQQVGAQEAQEAPPEEDAAQEEHEGAGCSSEEEAQEAQAEVQAQDEEDEADCTLPGGEEDEPPEADGLPGGEEHEPLRLNIPEDDEKDEPQEDDEQAEKVPVRLKLCRFHATVGCTNASCHFSHNRKHWIPSDGDDYFCKFWFQARRCAKGDKCTFLHDHGTQQGCFDEEEKPWSEKPWSDEKPWKWSSEKPCSDEEEKPWKWSSEKPWSDDKEKPWKWSSDKPWSDEEDKPWKWSSEKPWSDDETEDWWKWSAPVEQPPEPPRPPKRCGTPRPPETVPPLRVLPFWELRGGKQFCKLCNVLDSNGLHKNSKEHLKRVAWRNTQESLTMATKRRLDGEMGGPDMPG